MFETNYTEFPCKRGKVRDIYDLGDKLVIITTDRISAFDWVLPTPILGKGICLNTISNIWFLRLSGLVPNHVITCNYQEMPKPFCDDVRLHKRAMMVKKLKPLPVECIVRGFLTGSAYQEYKETGMVCGTQYPKGLPESTQIPIAFTPSTKAESGHDVNITLEQCGEHLWDSGLFSKKLSFINAFEDIQHYSKQIYSTILKRVWWNGLIIADTKLEFGLDQDENIVLIDEVATPDSSRFWAIENYCVGSSPPSYDKQYVRDWLKASGWDRNSPPPELPEEVVKGTVERYEKAVMLAAK